MKCLVWFLGVVAWSAGLAAGSCQTDHYFAMHNVSADDRDTTAGAVCGGRCCGRGREELLQVALSRKVGSRAAAVVRPIAELLLSTRHTLQEHLIELSHQSQNKTAVLFAQVYRGQAARTHAPLAALYDDIRALIQPPLERDPTTSDDLGSPPPRHLEESTKKFFRDVFPVAFNNVLKLDHKQFTPEYEACLRDAYDAVRPFGDVPQQLGSTLSRSIEAARALLQVLAIGAGTLVSSAQILMESSDDTCSRALLRAIGCPWCLGHGVKPCRDYCLNVFRGCVGSRVSALEGAWSGYVEGVERLARMEADAALRSLDARASDAIMHALESHAVLEKKVRQECGPHTTVDYVGSTSSHYSKGGSRRDVLRAPPPDTELLQFAASLAATKRIFSGVADRLCDEGEFVHESSQDCWNGEQIGSYSKPLAPSSSLSDQRYNSEVTGGAPQDPQVAALGDRLRQARQMLVAHSWLGEGAPAAEAFMQGDEAGEEGSGSGRSYDDDAAYDAEGSGEEGSGAHRIAEGKIYTGDESIHPSTPKPSSAFIATPSTFVFSIASMLALRCLT